MGYVCFYSILQLGIRILIAIAFLLRTVKSMLFGEFIFAYLVVLLSLKYVADVAIIKKVKGELRQKA